MGLRKDSMLVKCKDRNESVWIDYSCYEYDHTERKELTAAKCKHEHTCNFFKNTCHTLDLFREKYKCV